MNSKGNMYKKRKISWNPFVGCGFECCYCAFRTKLMRRKQACMRCYHYKPHIHPERLTHEYIKKLPKTKGDEFIWCCSSGDISFIQKKWMDRILEIIETLSDKTFFFQTKNPKFYEDYEFSENVILGITLETDFIKGYQVISLAPPPEKRAEVFKRNGHARKAITIEPILWFNKTKLVSICKEIGPEWVAVGYDSKANYLPEPPLSKTLELISELETFTRVERKTLRESYFEIAPQLDPNQLKITDYGGK